MKEETKRREREREKDKVWLTHRQQSHSQKHDQTAHTKGKLLSNPQTTCPNRHTHTLPKPHTPQPLCQVILLGIMSSYPLSRLDLTFAKFLTNLL